MKSLSLLNVLMAIVLVTATDKALSMQKPATKLHGLPRELRDIIITNIKQSETLKSALNGLYNLFHSKLITLDDKTATALIDELFNKFSPEYLKRMEKTGRGIHLVDDFYHEMVQEAVALKFYELYPVLIHKITKGKIQSREVFDSLDAIALSIIENRKELLYPEINKIFEYLAPGHKGPTAQNLYSLLTHILTNKVEPLYSAVKKYLPVLRRDYNIMLINMIIKEKISSLYFASEFTLKKDLDEMNSYFKQYPNARFIDQSALREEKLITETLRQLEAAKR